MTKNIGQANANGTNTSIADLKKKVNNFAVFDRQGKLVGVVHDLIVDANRRLNLVISNRANQQTLEYDRQLTDKNPSLFRLQSQRIKKIDKPTKSVFIDFNKSEIEYMPEYSETEKPGDVSDGLRLSNSTEQLANNQPINSPVEPVNLAEVSEEQIIRLLEERLVVESSKRKVGEVIVRKVIETRTIEVPVRREKLIVEQISPEYKQLAEIDLGQGEITGVDLTGVERLEVTHFDSGLTVSGEFSSPKTASLLLNAIALERNHGCNQVRVTIAVENESHQKKYQDWFDRCSQGRSPKSEK
ncbi:YsnF/AvaK domain-containing protein [Nostoc sp. 'Peltigera membranacea cyanobiont' N6]|uniref:YsnF/AvaK domain-containing protein n=1 Tax=Nostoc sp. 'Peltigera membranacea cyanobiont' N6 TaxID=1261031 RepID=UPI0021583B5B|nr:YsnF/AvaK domain-containing protein [Nostoc sp. 'Peltigera membranacea cyanobiont' N6]